ncbi:MULTISPECIES: hypothetical protein [unclassified Paenibacillus]|uniref:hypothetical protein n=1 Tax=unclassified Paenibacillus TaxID=185978 RepID=UPI0009A6446C|nr:MULTISPECIES: hypothetical protein [unclassified Paenibacillus]SLJ92703.1 hypothetical protein SAMN06272722_1011117 [Paenibacillus sp. RU5A]SOC58531.1 hypothetical protein SAMN05880581_10173 [Paenibacillus sp. RU26A]SOC67583.1 hypothetical protein SAMN05880586_10173 [Paenibacillus sp. RU5M]
MKVKVTMDPRAMQKLSKAPIEALEVVVNGKEQSILTEIANAGVVPKQTGELERSAWVDKTGLKKGQVKIVYDTPYARRLYWHPEYNFRRDKNSNAQGLWLEAWQKEQKGWIRKTFEKLIKKFGGGFIK